MISSRWGRWLQIQAPAGFLALLIMTATLAGCITGGQFGPKPTEEQRGQPLAGGGFLSRLEDGRKGFVIRENSSLDAEELRIFEQAALLLTEQEYEQAIELLATVIASSPKVTAPHINIAIALMKLDRLEEAENHLEIALGLVPEHPVANNEYGLLLRQTGRFAEARAVYQKILATFPEYHPARRNLGILCDLYLNDLECALEQYEIYHAVMPDDRQVELWVADLRLRLGR